ncbi:MAG: hypothetical protein ACI9NC_005935 [Verrucomicrobiales bacterium]|jgi:hypothetical protein
MIPIAKRRFFSARALTTLVSIFVLPLAGHASLALYDASISADETGAGPVPLAKLTSRVTTFNSALNPADIASHANAWLVPEPSGMALIGLAGLAIIIRRRR